MKKSDTIGSISKALFVAQQALLPAMKNATNPHLRNKYADLGAVWEACEGALKAAGLVVVQCPGTSDRGVTLTTTVIHAESGEWIESDLTMPAGKGDAQAIGSAITYARRYALSAMLGVLAEDDDGEAAQGRGKAEAARNGNGPSAPSGADFKRIADQIAAALKKGDTAWAEQAFRAYLGKSSGAPDDLRRSVWTSIEAAKKPANGVANG